MKILRVQSGKKKKLPFNIIRPWKSIKKKQVIRIIAADSKPGFYYALRINMQPG